MGRGVMVKVREGAEGGERVVKGDGGVDLDICGGGHRVPSYATADALVLYCTRSISMRGPKVSCIMTRADGVLQWLRTRFIAS